MALTVGMVTIDCVDALALGRWWAEQVGGEIVQENEGFFVVVSTGEGNVMLAFQKVERVTPGKNKMHLDLVTADLDAEVERLEAAGAEQVATQTMDDFRWVTLADPEGNYFDVAQGEG
ncbi:VOC family protein [Mumia zhuanghuii]|uniref:VOC family protein n=2 Tax=Mumia TaxID=1546255 RepID=A0ABW1QIY7_9ACTN|nr:MULTISPECIES: VOC family protein [Mumia]KAA1425284.1 VOC family protein [Mumia zhuanghuii]